MKPEPMTEALESAARQLGVQVRYEALAPGGTAGGGLCKVRGEWWVIVDKKSTPSERAAILVDALAGFEFQTLELAPKVREALEKRRATRQPAGVGV
jgi:hypothetical protein